MSRSFGWAGRLVLFLGLACPVLWVSLGTWFLRLEREDPLAAATAQALEEALGRIESNRNPLEVHAIFFRRLEHRVFQHPEPAGELVRLVPHLRRKFGDGLELVFLDGTGSPHAGLCDRVVPVALAKRFFVAYRAFLDQGIPLPPLVRSFMKTFIGPGCTVQGEGHGHLTLVSTAPHARLAYFSRPRPQGMILVFLRWDPAVRERALLEQIARQRSTPSLRELGGSVSADGRPGTPPRVVMTLARPRERFGAVLSRLGFRGLLPPSCWSRLRRSPDGAAWFGDVRLAYRPLTPSLYLVGGVSIRDRRQEATIASGRHALAWVLGLALAAWTLGASRGLTAPFVGSVRGKLLLAFLYAALIPLSLLGVTARNFLTERRQVLEEEVHQRVEKNLQAFDAEFEEHWDRVLTSLRKHFITFAPGATDSRRSFLEGFERARTLYEFDLCHIVDLAGNRVFHHAGPNMPGNLWIGEKTFSQVTRRFTARYRLVTGQGAEPSPPKGKEDPIMSQMMGKFTLLDNKRVQFGRLEGLQVLLPLGDAAGRFTHLAYLWWDAGLIVQTFLTRNLQRFAREREMPGLFAWSMARPDQVYPGAFPHRDLIRPVLERVVSRSHGWRGRASAAGQASLLTGLRATRMKPFAFLVVTPDLEIQREIGGLAWALRFVSMVLLGIGAVAVLLLSRMFMQPMRELANGMEALAHQDFSTSIPVTSRDELGALASLFNEALADLQDLAVARAVQESLFPRAALRQGSWEIFGSSQPASQVGGDYFDYFALDDHRVLIIIGDVSGHGVGAALVVAMAKAIIGHPATTGSPTEILATMNRILLAILSRKKIMSCCMALLDTIGGVLTIANAGQTYPILLRAGPPAFLELRSFPLGAVNNWKAASRAFGPFDHPLFLFYTDGLVEAHDQVGQPVGFDRLLEALPDLVRESAPATELAVRTWHQCLTGFQPPADDITLIVVQEREGVVHG